jgi:hypothetical protein
MAKTTTLVVCSLALTLPILLWQAVSAQSVDGLSQIRVPMDGMDTESSSLLVLGVLLIGASSLASRVMPAKPPLHSDVRMSADSNSLVLPPTN